jgi:hypothetical protein
MEKVLDELHPVDGKYDVSMDNINRLMKSNGFEGIQKTVKQISSQ